MPSSSRLRRASVVLVPALLLASLTACGGTKTGYGDATQPGLGTVTVGGRFGTKPTITWNAQPSYPTSVQSKTLIQGKGPAVSGTDELALRIYIADPLNDLYVARTSCHTSSSASPSAGGSPSPSPSTDPSASAAPTPVTVTPCPDNVTFPIKGSWAYQSKTPETLTLSQVTPIFQQVLQGAHVGSRVEALAGSPDIFPAQSGGVAGNASLGIGTKDPVVMVLDVVRIVPQLPDRNAHNVPLSALPKIKLSQGKPVGLDFKGIAKPAENATLKRAIIKAGTGRVVKSTDTVKVNYLGMTYGATKPFDENYTTKPISMPLSSVVEGWKTGLSGVKVGSRVVLQIPPELGYGSNPPQAQPGRAAIAPNSTLYFVVDVLGVG